MALLEYDGLGFQGRTRDVLSQAFAGVRDFYEFQKAALEFLREERVFRVGWRATGRRVEGLNRKLAKAAQTAVWVELVEPEDVGDPDALFDWFFDEDVKSLYEDPESALAGDDAPSSRRIRQRRPPKENDIRVLKRDRDDNQLLLSRLPAFPGLLLWPNTTPLERQQEALKQLTDAPRPHHKPIVNLLVSDADANWPSFEPADVSADGWHILTDPERPGTASQRAFVAKALATPDFGISEQSRNRNR